MGMGKKRQDTYDMGYRNGRADGRDEVRQEIVERDHGREEAQKCLRNSAAATKAEQKQECGHVNGGTYVGEASPIEPVGTPPTEIPQPPSGTRVCPRVVGIDRSNVDQRSSSVSSVENVDQRSSSEGTYGQSAAETLADRWRDEADKMRTRAGELAVARDAYRKEASELREALACMVKDRDAWRRWKEEGWNALVEGLEAKNDKLRRQIDHHAATQERLRVHANLMELQRDHAQQQRDELAESLTKPKPSTDAVIRRLIAELGDKDGTVALLRSEATGLRTEIATMATPELVNAQAEVIATQQGILERVRALAQGWEAADAIGHRMFGVVLRDTLGVVAVTPPPGGGA